VLGGASRGFDAMPGAGGLPSVSIVMPTWKRVAFLRETLESIRAQHLEDWELIVADDGSGPELRAAVAMLTHDDPRVRLLPLEHSGNPPAVRNAARARARGELIAFIDSDDVWLPEKLHLQVRALQARPESGWSYTGFTLIDSKGNALQRRGLSAFGAADPGSREALFASLLEGKALVAQSSVMMRRALFDALGGYDIQFPICGDYELWLRAAQRSPAAILPTPLVQVRRHQDHYSDDIAACADFFAVLNAVHHRGVPQPLRAVMRRRRGQAAAALARSCARHGAGRTMTHALLSSVAFGWRELAWWRGAVSACARLCTPPALHALMRRLLRRPQAT